MQSFRKFTLAGVVGRCRGPHNQRGGGESGMAYFPPSDPSPVGADINFSGDVTGDNAVIFFSHYAAESLMADLNNDNSVDAADVAHFAAAHN